MTGTASPGPTLTLPDLHLIDTASSGDSPLSSLTTSPTSESGSPLVASEEPVLPETNGAIGAVKEELVEDVGAHETNGINGDDQDEDGIKPLTNGHSSHDEAAGHNDHDGERPAKRRRTTDSTPPPAAPRRPNPISPPWKKFEADGPSTFNEGGRRKSGRINTIPLELHTGDKRITRRAVQQSSPPSSKPQGTVNGHTTRRSSSSQNANTSSAHAMRRLSSTTRSAAPSNPSPPTPLSKQSSSRRAQTAESRSSSSRLRRPSPSPASQRASQASATRIQPSRSSRSTRLQSDGSVSSSRRVPPKPELPTRTTPRIRLRTRTLTIPIVHPDQTKIRPKLAADLPEYFEKAVDIPVEEGGLLASEDEPRMTDEMAASEAAIISRIEKETEEGGILTEPRCIAFEPEASEEPPRQWAHMDHLTKAMANFRKLMLMEQQRHRATAKKLAEACRDEWIRRQPKSAEQIEAEARAMWIARYRVVMRAMFGTWENVRLEINRRRLREYEAEEQRRLNAALQETIALSEQKLQARRAHLDSEVPSDEDMEDDEDLDDDLEDVDSNLSLGSDSGDVESDSEEGDDEDDNMSSSDDDEEGDKEDAKSVVSDEGLTQAQLREKYAKISDVTITDGGTNVDDVGPDAPALTDVDDPNGDDETSDESVDMDDDLGSTDMDSDEDEGSDDADGSDGDNETSEEEEEQASGLLGMLFGKAELKKLKTETAAVKEEEPEEPSAKEVDGGDDTVLPNENAQETDGIGQREAEVDQFAAEKEVSGSETTKQNQLQQPLRVEGVLSVPMDDNDDNEVSMVDMPPEEDDVKDIPNMEATVPLVDDDIKDIPSLEVTVPPADDDRVPPSPDTDAVTTAVSPGRSQSPRTLDTKPSDLDTPKSADAELLGAPKEASASRSVSPAPTTSAVPKTEIPFLLRGTLREYQHYGLDWLAGLYANNTNGILADEMGLGKTIQTIALLAHLACHHEVWGPHLVVVPTSVILNWEMEFKKWCPAFKILTYYGSQEERKRKRIGWTNDDIWNVCITSYQIVVQDQQVFKRRRWHYMILDEAHNIKNFKSQRWQSLLGFNTHSRLLLTGTPLQNNLTELWSLLFFLMPPENGVGGFADLQEFHDWFHKPESQILESGREQMDEEARAIISKLHKVLRPYLLRRLKADVEKQMPAKYEHVELCRLSKRQRELYDGFLARSDTRETLSSGNYLSIINCLMQLRKVCNHPDLFVDRPIMTSFRMQKSVAATYESTTEHVVQRHLDFDSRGLVSLNFLNLVPTQHEDLSAATASRINQLATNRVLSDLKEAQRARLPHPYHDLDASTVQSNLAYLENAARWKRFEELQHCCYVNALRRQQRPIYGKGLVDMLTLHTEDRPFKPRPKVPAKIMEWFENDSFLLHNLVQPLERRSDSLEMTITKFACVTPAVITRDMNGILLGRQGADTFEEWDLKLSAPVKTLPFMERQPPKDPWHEARMRLTIQFPDKRLLQYDCGKLQALDRLLRRLQAGGHRALIFTQMTKVLDILEQFLNIHGHKYLRLDGATKIEQRQILTDRFNHDNRILCFILSTRSGGLGINLTGADTVIFYDQDWNPAMDKQCQDRCHRIGQTRDVHIYRLVSEHTIEANILRKASQKQMLDDVVIQEGEFTTDYFNKLSVRDVLGGAGGGVGGAGGGGGDGAVDDVGQGEAAANAAMDRVLGGVETAGDQRTAGRVLEQAEDTEDVAAARLAEKEILQDDADFSERPAGTGGSGAATAAGQSSAATPVTTSGVSSVRQGTPAVSGEGNNHNVSTAGRSGLGLFAESVGADETQKEIEYNAWGGRVRTIDDYMLGWMAEQLKGTALELPKDKKKSKKKKGKDTRKR